MDQAPLQVSVVMPALDEEVNLERAVRDTFHAFASLGIRGEIVLINDGSNDGTGKLAERLQGELGQIQVIHHNSPHGIGSSFWEGAQRATGDAVIMLPGDAENDPLEILRYLPLLDQVDMIIPFVFNGETRSLRRRLLSKVYKAVINLTFGMLLNYMNGTVIYRRSVLRSLNLRSTGFFYQTELLIKGIRRGYLYAEVPCALGKRAAGKSKAVSLRSLRRVTSDYLNTIYSVYFGDEGGGAVFPLDSATFRRIGPAAGEST